MTFIKKTLIAIFALSSIGVTLDASAATFKTPKHYSIILLDGEKVGGIFSSEREVTLEPGRHQILVLFKGNFKKGKDRLLTSASNPIVINIPNMAADDEYTFTFPKISDYDAAQDYADKQVITLKNHGQNITQEDASYFILQSEKGFQLDRDFKDELASLGLLYEAPKAIEASNKKEDSLKTCRESNMQNCPQVVVSPINASNNKKPSVNNLSNTQAINNPNVNQGTFEGLKAIYNGADPATKAAFKAWINAQ